MNQVVRIFEVEPRRIPLADLKDGECKYPYGDSDFVFCGRRVQDRSSYCPGHHALYCWQPVPARGR